MFVLTCDHQIPNRPPLRVEVDDEVVVEHRTSDWPEFVFVTAYKGSGWVPARHLAIDGNNATVIRPYDTTELAARVGERVERIHNDAQSGWSWCRNDRGEEGWIPNRSLDQLN
ncbi:SH3 domain-containing protein [Arcanobacterium pinnipediorum]|uniref:SH3 domain-containing protein n=1 Tax=Arcanobacterium pinnipediorum TaxID=1503041 RepID=A0ABY5AF62_9ACTO|nr:SH3 domain-containing protein [Arcanobacterium pinnipediorum]USR78815.1 SH3 domain-containing protein [Arcanobacterium pinnipediorum]